MTKESNEDMRAIQKLLEKGMLFPITFSETKCSFFFWQGIIRPVVDSTYEFEDALEAYDRIMSLRAVGKVVVKIDPTCN